jgi:predicted DNA-binding transcriptional regulator AlpA
MPSAPTKEPMISVQHPEKRRRQPARPQQSIPRKMPNSHKPSVASPNETSDTLDDVSFLRLPEVKAVTGLSKTSIYDLIREKSFPSPVRLGPRAVGWVKSEIKQWAVQRVHASRSAA